MPHEDERALDQDRRAVDATGQSSWAEDAEQWLAELRHEEHQLAPWLAVDRIGEETKVSRG